MGSAIPSLGKVEVGVSQLYHADLPLPATSHPAAPHPEEGIYIKVK